MNFHDRDIILSTIVGSSIVYIVLSAISSNKQVPLLVVVFIIGNMISRLRSFETFIEKLKSPAIANNVSNAIVSSGGNDAVFNKLPYAKRQEIISSIKSLQLYAVNNKKFNDKKRKLFKMMSWRQQNLCKSVGYLDKLNSIDKLVVKNQGFLNKVVEATINTYGISFSDFDLIKNFVDNNSYRVVESLSHFNRDWNMEVEGEDFELDSILTYINRNLEKIIPQESRQNTRIIVPGSGLGRIPYELSTKGYGDIHAVEFSGLMYLFNQFIYNNGTFKFNELEIFPYIHTLSNFKNLKDQCRSVLVPQMQKPDNLTLHLEDFNTFEIPKSDKSYDNIVVVTAYFIDTAENLIDYLDSIQSLAKPYKNAYWINIGPLKYGTAPKVELNMEELRDLRENLGWKDLDYLNSLEAPVKPDQSGLYGYATDKKSLWQGYYGLNGWCSQKK